ncbi:DNA polymerase III subunit epsilon-like protein [Perkinsela sp. CCAP 1560/4]|nr:DNA polymerase III subunit epsilon-like protein [Perkinsela sp. CCAP 1560/4]|eukprot:KNH06355.1 DNA polymerase III subunit epsilon-like protein [Perkinsela sp. CCAP 1560/4]
MLRSLCSLLAHHSLRELLSIVSRNYAENKLHELPDETLLSYGRLRRIPIVGTRDDILKRLYRYLYRRECSELVNIICYDLEFTGLPTWDPVSGIPNQEIIEIGAYSPHKKESFSCLVRPELYKMSEEAASLTQISTSVLQSEGIPIAEALKRFYLWLANCVRSQQTDVEPNDSMSIPADSAVIKPVDNQRKDGHSLSAELSPEKCKPSNSVMLISHGGSLHDIRMLKYYSTSCDISIPNSIYFADSMRLLRECTHYKGDNLGVLKLDSLMKELGITSHTQSHRALTDAISTWKVLGKAIHLYSSTHLTPAQDITKKYLQWRKM